MFSVRENQIRLMVYASFVLILGILFCAVPKTAIDVISIIMGVVFIIGGLVSILDGAVNKKTCLNKDSIGGAFVLAFGILFIANKLGGLVLDYIPYFLIVFGSVILLDSILLITNKSKKVITVFITELVFSIACITLGILMLVNDNFKSNSSLIFGLILIAWAVFLIIIALLFKKLLIKAVVDDAVDDIKEDIDEYLREKDIIDAEAKEKNSQE